jgi:hypothetical protein
MTAGSTGSVAVIGDKGFLEKSGTSTPRKNYKRARPAGNQDHGTAVEADFQKPETLGGLFLVKPYRA